MNAIALLLASLIVFVPGLGAALALYGPGEIGLATRLALMAALGSCLSGAVERREPFGVWGGEIFERGSITAQKKARGRPRTKVAC